MSIYGNLSKDIIRGAINESFESLNEAAKIINGTSKETGYPLTNIKLAGINVAVYVKGDNTPSEEDLKKLDNDYNIIKSKYNKLVFDKKQLLGDLDESEEEAKKLLSMSINEIKKQINLYEVVYFPYDNRFEFCFSVNRGSLLKTYSDTFAINLTINGKDIKVDSDEI